MDDDEDRFERVPLSEWRRLRTTLETFCSGGVRVERAARSDAGSGDGTDGDAGSGDGTGGAGAGEQLVCRFGRATFTVSRGGDVEAGMPLHGFTASDVEAIGVDADAGELLVETAESRYVFRRP